MFKKIFLSIAFVLTAVALGAQSLSVESFRLLETDLTANTAGTMKRDQNGDVAALIRIVTSETGFTFENGMMGIVASEQKTGEVWVYVPFGTSKLTIAHQQLGVLRDWSIPIPVEKGRTYELRLAAGVVHTYVEDRPNGQFVTFSVQPGAATVTVDDGQPRALGDDGTLSLMLPFGSHVYRIDAAGYLSESGTFEVTGEKQKKEVVLKSTKGTVTLSCPMSDARLYLDGNYVGDGKWSGPLDPAQMYLVEAKLEGHRTRSITFSLDVQEEKTVSVPAPQPIYGTLSIMSTPNEATILIDGAEIGETPLLTGNLLVGEHELEFRKKDYTPYRMTVSVQEGKMTPVEADMRGNYTAAATVQPADRTTGSGVKTPKSRRTTEKRRLDSRNLYVGLGWQAGRLWGLSGELGLYRKNFNFEIAYNEGGSGAKIVHWLPYQNDQFTNSYSYYISNVISVRTGYGLFLAKSLVFTPQIGINYNQVAYQGEPVTYTVSGTASMRMEWSPIRHLSIVAAPVYSIPLMMGNVAKRMNENTNVFDDWFDGFSARFGIDFYF